eukprot:GHVN01000570.1.p1 GENE.GHVN01000570.1~~GHVN01000570.1.p1  ORF type:complete len:114 (-),score=9.19 GHVN01000570.1:741-1082(-)
MQAIALDPFNPPLIWLNLPRPPTRFRCPLLAQLFYNLSSVLPYSAKQCPERLNLDLVDAYETEHDSLSENDNLFLQIRSTIDVYLSAYHQKTILPTVDETSLMIRQVSICVCV